MIREPKYFVDFMRDAPEPTGEEVEDADMELPKIYEPIESFKVASDTCKSVHLIIGRIIKPCKF